MAFKTYKGRVVSIGDSVSSTSSDIAQYKYSYIEMEGGTMVNRLTAMTGLNGLLLASFNASEPVELHVNEVLTGVPDPGSALIAIKRADGRLYAINLPKMPWMASLFPLFFLVSGLLTVWLFGLGLYLWYVGWKVQKGLRMASQIRSYIDALPNCIKV